MITQKIAEIIEKNTKRMTYSPIVPFNFIEVNTLIRELCRYFERTKHPVHWVDFNAHEFTQTALGIKEREYDVNYPVVITGQERVRARSEKDAIAKIQLKHPHRINPSITAEEVK